MKPLLARSTRQSSLFVRNAFSVTAGTSEVGEEGGGQGVDDSAHEGAAAGAETAEHAAIISGATRVSMAGSPLVHAAVQEARRPPPFHPPQHIICRTPAVVQAACRECMTDGVHHPKHQQLF